MTKNDLAIFKEHLDKRFLEVDKRFVDIDRQFERVDHRFRETKLETIITLGIINVSSITIAVAVLAWIIKIN